MRQLRSVSKPTLHCIICSLHKTPCIRVRSQKTHSQTLPERTKQHSFESRSVSVIEAVRLTWISGGCVICASELNPVSWWWPACTLRGYQDDTKVDKYIHLQFCKTINLDKYICNLLKEEEEIILTKCTCYSSMLSEGCSVFENALDVAARMAHTSPTKFEQPMILLRVE